MGKILVTGATGFTGGAAVVIDGCVVSAVNEERLDRNKNCLGFPRPSIVEVTPIVLSESL